MERGVDCAPILTAPDGILRLFILSKRNDHSRFGLEAKWLDPAQHTSFQAFYTNANLQASLPEGERTRYPRLMRVRSAHARKHFRAWSVAASRVLVCGSD